MFGTMMVSGAVNFSVDVFAFVDALTFVEDVLALADILLLIASFSLSTSDRKSSLCDALCSDETFFPAPGIVDRSL